MGIAPQHLLELDQRMLVAITQVFKDRAKAAADASKRKRGRRA